MLIWDGSAWSQPVDTVDAAAYTNVSCPAADDCVLTGGPYTATFDGTTITPLPNLDESSTALACASTTLCFAGERGLAAWRFAGTAWSATSETHGSESLWFTPAGCSRAGTACVAGGRDGVGANATSVWLFDGAGWTWSRSIADPPTAVSCGSRTFCVVTTKKGRGYIWNGTTWSAPVTFAWST